MRTRTTIYFELELHRALRVKALEIGTSLSALVNTALRRSLAEDADDLLAFSARGKEKGLDFEAVVKDLRRRGRL